MTAEHAVLTCSACGREAEHTLRYTGRLLHSTACSACGHVVRHDQRALFAEYLQDLEQRVASKPRRLALAARRDPVRFLIRLPVALLRQPIKIAQDLWTLWRD